MEQIVYDLVHICYDLVFIPLHPLPSMPSLKSSASATQKLPPVPAFQWFHSKSRTQVMQAPRLAIQFHIVLTPVSERTELAKRHLCEGHTPVDFTEGRPHGMERGPEICSRTRLMALWLGVCQSTSSSHGILLCNKLWTNVQTQANLKLWFQESRWPLAWISSLPHFKILSLQAFFFFFLPAGFLIFIWKLVISIYLL